MMPLMVLLASHNVDATTNGFIWLKPWCYTSFQLSWHKECNGVADNTVIIWYDTSASGVNGQKCDFPPHFNCLDLENAMVLYLIQLAWYDAKKVPVLHLIVIILNKEVQLWYWWGHWHHMMLILMASHDPKSHIASPFDHLDVTNGMVPLMTLLESCNTDISMNGITWSKKLGCTSFWLAWPNQCHGAIDYTTDITGYWCQWHHMTKKCHVAFHFDHFDLTNGTVPLVTLLASCNTDSSINDIT